MALKGNPTCAGIALTGAILRIDSFTGGKRAGWMAHANLYLNEDAANPPKQTRIEQQLAPEQPTIQPGEEKIPEPVYIPVEVDITPEPKALPFGGLVVWVPYQDGVSPYPTAYAHLKDMANEAHTGVDWEDC